MGNREFGNKMTIHDVARELGVSSSTVSRAISGKGRIGTDTRDRILSYIAKKGFYPNAAAQSLAQAKTYNIAVVMQEVNTLVDMPFFQTCMFGIGEVAQANDYDILVLTTSGKDTRQLERVIQNRKVDGMILTRTYENDIFVKYLQDKKIPFVTIGSVNVPDVVQIDHDNVEACKELTGILLSKGMKRIAYLGRGKSMVVNINRQNGYLRAHEEAGIEVDKSLVYMELDNATMIKKAVDELLKAHADCILCQDDAICDDVLYELTEKKIQLPAQMKIASCHNSRLLEHNSVPITSLKFNILELGRTACKTLLDLIEGKNVSKKILLDYEVVLKESTK